MVGCLQRQAVTRRPRQAIYDEFIKSCLLSVSGGSMDATTVVFLSLAGAGAAAAVLHMFGWVPPRYRRMLAGVQTDTARAIGGELTVAISRLTFPEVPTAQELSEAVYVALNRVAAEQQVAMEKAMKEAVTTEGQVKSQLLNAVKGLKYNQGEIDTALAEAILGPALPILRQFAPSLAAMLEENPQLVDFVIEHPLFKKHVQPRIEAFLGHRAEAASTGLEAHPFWKP